MKKIIYLNHLNNNRDQESVLSLKSLKMLLASTERNDDLFVISVISMQKS